MSVSKVSICNRALSFIKANNRITDITEDSEEARLCNILFDEALDTLLETHPWNFATYRSELAMLATTPTFDYTYAFQLPTDPYCLKVIKVVNGDVYVIDDYEIEGRTLVTNEDSVYVKYIGRVTNYNNLSTLFRTALAYYLASELAEPLTGSTSMGNQMASKFNYYLRKAKANDGSQGKKHGEDDSKFSWDTARF